ncbi:hypothetical protein [Microvirga massiliensis]|uniref:hypothetical protein n=1 Tax=Microvirga massiliensis TaxID=1033741 RepID=UPI00062BC74E|nr:hypothetical protein [Microvirga massiliensis]
MERVTKPVGGVAPAEAARLAAIVIIAFVAAAAYGASRPAPGPTQALDHEPLMLLLSARRIAPLAGPGGATTGMRSLPSSIRRASLTAR